MNHQNYVELMHSEKFIHLYYYIEMQYDFEKVT